MKVSENFKLIGISILIMAGLVACGKQGSTETAASKVAATLSGTYMWTIPESGTIFTNIYYPDGAYIAFVMQKLPHNDNPKTITMQAGMCLQNGAQLDCKITGEADIATAIEKGRPGIAGDDFKPKLNTEFTNLIKMDADGSFSYKRIRTVKDGQTQPPPVENGFGGKFIPRGTGTMGEASIRQSIPAQFFQ